MAPSDDRMRAALRGLIVRIGVLMLLCGGVTGGALAILAARLQASEDMPITINVAGRQRMLAERITQLMLAREVRSARLSSDSTLVRDIREAMQRQQQAHAMLLADAAQYAREGDAAPLTAVTLVTPLLDELHGVAEQTLRRTLRATPDDTIGPRGLARLRRAEARLLSALEQMVTALQDVHMQRLEANRRFALSAIAASVGLLLLLITLVLRPAVRTLRGALAEQAALRDEVARREAELRTLALTAPVGIFRTDADGHCVFVNRAYCDVTGLSPSEAAGAGWRAALHDEDLHRISAAWREAVETGCAFSGEYRFRRPDGSVREVAVTAAPVLRTGDAVDGWIGIVMDQTERVALQREQMRSATFQLALVQGTPYAVIATDPAGTIVQFNPAAEQLLGYRADEVVGRMTPSPFHDAAEVAARAAELSRELGRHIVPGFEVFVARSAAGETETREWTYVRRDGARVPVQLAVSPIRTAAGELIGFLGVARDMRGQLAREAERARQLEQLRAAEQRAREATRLKSAFVANMSHEIRTPMNAILGFTDLVLEHSTLDAFQRDSLETVRGAAAHLLELINDVLDFSKIEAGQMKVERVPFALRDVVRDVLVLLQPRAVAKSLSLTADVADAIGSTQVGDPTRVRQILMNFIGNAVKFTDAGAVTVRVRPSAPGCVRLEVIDTGIGLTADAASRVFEHFVQADDSTTRRFGGTGLGLAIVKELAELMGGQVGVASAPGAGSTFWCELPLEHADVAGEVPDAAVA